MTVPVWKGWTVDGKTAMEVKAITRTHLLGCHSSSHLQIGWRDLMLCQTDADERDEGALTVRAESLQSC